jgi:hypothetical protein
LDLGAAGATQIAGPDSRGRKRLPGKGDRASLSHQFAAGQYCTAGDLLRARCLFVAVLVASYGLDLSPVFF